MSGLSPGVRLSEDLIPKRRSNPGLSDMIWDDLRNIAQL
jgi:hypothetical protein